MKQKAVKSDSECVRCASEEADVKALDIPLSVSKVLEDAAMIQDSHILTGLVAAAGRTWRRVLRAQNCSPGAVRSCPVGVRRHGGHRIGRNTDPLVSDFRTIPKPARTCGMVPYKTRQHVRMSS